jgi:hypothetical protein
MMASKAKKKSIAQNKDIHIDRNNERIAVVTKNKTVGLK